MDALEEPEMEGHMEGGDLAKEVDKLMDDPKFLRWANRELDFRARQKKEKKNAPPVQE